MPIGFQLTFAYIFFVVLKKNIMNEAEMLLQMYKVELLGF